MTLEELIEQCKRANELATDGGAEVTTLYKSEFTLVNIGTEIVCTKVSRPTGEAIAIRHNLSSDVLRYLEKLAALEVAINDSGLDPEGDITHLRILVNRPKEDPTP